MQLEMILAPLFKSATPPQKNLVRRTWHSDSLTLSSPSVGCTGQSNALDSAPVPQILDCCRCESSLHIGVLEFHHQLVVALRIHIDAYREPSPPRSHPHHSPKLSPVKNPCSVASLHRVLFDASPLPILPHNPRAASVLREHPHQVSERY